MAGIGGLTVDLGLGRPVVPKSLHCATRQVVWGGGPRREGAPVDLPDGESIDALGARSGRRGKGRAEGRELRLGPLALDDHIDR